MKKLGDKPNKDVAEWPNFAPSLMRHIYHRTLSDPPLRRILIHIVTLWMQPAYAKKEDRPFPREFLRDLCTATIERLHKESGDVRKLMQPIISFYVKTGAQDDVAATEDVEQKRPNKRRRIIAQGHPQMHSTCEHRLHHKPLKGYRVVLLSVTREGTGRALLAVGRAISWERASAGEQFCLLQY